MGCQRANDRKSYRFLFDIFFDRGVHFGKQRRYEENKHYGCVQSSRTVGIASCKLKLIIFIMFKVQVQPSRKHKYHNNSTKKRGCSRDTSYLSRSPLKLYIYTSISMPFRSVKVSLPSVSTVAFSTISRQPFAVEILALRMHAAGLTRSMSKKGCFPDNAAYERKILRTSEK